MKYILMLNPEESNTISINYNFILSILLRLKNKEFDFETKKLEQEKKLYSHEFSFNKGDFELFLNRDMNAISLEGDWSKTMGFISELPEGQKVYFLDESYNNHMIIDFLTTQEDIESIFFRAKN